MKATEMTAVCWRGAENAGVENAGVENAGVENTGAIMYGKPSNRK